jgi:gliding motility-associated-like protein
VLPSTVVDTAAAVCDSLIWYGTTYRSSTVATYTPAVGCNVLRLTLTVRHSTDTVIVHDVAENDLPYMFDTLTLTHDTTFTLHTINNADCDSTITVIVTVHFNQDTTVDSTVCEGQLPLLWNEVPFYLTEVDYTTNTIIHQTTIPSVHGADSLITMRLHLLYNSTDTISDTIYPNDLPSFTPPLPVSVSYTQNENDPALVTIIDSTIAIPNAVGCDSLVHYTLYLYRNYHTYDTIDRCINQLPYIYHGDTITGPVGEMSDSVMLTTVNGTDSILVLTLRIHPTYEVYDTIVVCPYESYIYEGVDYGGPADFDATLNSIHNCDSLVHVSLQARDTLFHLAPLMSFDDSVWYPADTTLIGCDPQNLWLNDTSASVSREWAFWSTASASDTTFDTLNIFDTVLPIGIYSFRIIAVGAEGCIDTVQRDSAIHIFQRPKSDFIYEPDIVPFHDPKISLTPQATPADSLTYRWLIALDNQGGQYDTIEHDEQQSDGRWHYTWEPLIDSGHYDVALVAYWKHTVIQIINTDTLTLSDYCTDTAHHPVAIVNTYLQFPSLVTPNGDGTNDTWEVVNLIEMGQYQTNELWIYNQWGALVFHTKNIDSHEQCWDPNATNSPDGTYYFRFSGKGRYGVIKQNGVIEVLR